MLVISPEFTTSQEEEEEEDEVLGLEFADIEGGGRTVMCIRLFNIASLFDLSKDDAGEHKARTVQ